MGFRDWANRVMLIFLVFSALILALSVGKVRYMQNHPIASIPNPPVWSEYPQVQLQSAKVIQNQPFLSANTKFWRYRTTEVFTQYRPNCEFIPIHPSNYGERYALDINGVPLKNEAIIVLHETSSSASSAINFFQTPHEDEKVQASYHTLIKLDGTVIYLVPPQKRAFGAGNSVFVGANGIETVQTNPTLPPSVNNFAYHASLETPPDGRGDNHIQSHSGYTQAQYNSLAWLIAQSQVPDERITTHRAVDRSGQRVDPLSFDFNQFFDLLHTFRQLRSSI